MEKPVTKKASEDPVKEFNEREVRANVIPVDERNLAHAIDVPVKEKKVESVEVKGLKKQKSSKSKISKAPKTKKTASKKTFNKNNWAEEFKTPINKKKTNGPIMIITEKPQASLKIAEALADKRIEMRSINGVNYYELSHNNKDIVVVCAVGHLFTLAQVKPRNPWPTFDIKWAPNYLVRKNDFTKRYYDVISRVSKNASEFVVATDYDIEGEVIGMNIVRYICGQKDAERMKFSTLTAKEIKEAFENRSMSLDWKQGIAGETRHYLDWIYGINLSRALMEAIKTTGKFRLMSIGRVQGPALSIIVQKEREISRFIPSKYWQVFAEVYDGKNKLEVKYVKDITNEEETKIFNNFKGKKGIARTEKSQKKLTPLTPFDLTTLQTEAYKFYKITPSKTLEIAQKLYLSGVISYPRTSSQKIPREIGYNNILDRLKNRFRFVENITRKTPIEGKKTDPAHPSIYPTGEFHSLEDDEKKIYELIVRRFVNCFCDDAIIDDKKINVDIEGKKFTAKGASIAQKGWMEVYHSIMKENEIPDMDGVVNVNKISIEEKMTQPPHRYTPASIVSELEKRNLGTKATRANILETLYDRGYISEKSIEATSLGIALINTLEKNCPIIIDEKLTRNIEKNLDDIRESKNPQAKEEAILKDTQNNILKIGEHFKKNKNNIGNDLVKATTELWEEQKKGNELTECKVCKKGKLTIKFNKASRRYFVACDNYPECKTTYTLPPNSLIKRTEQICKECNFPMLMSLRKGKRPWIFCFNPECPTRQRKENEDN